MWFQKDSIIFERDWEEGDVQSSRSWKFELRVARFLPVSFELRIGD
jgi:hypothetical protein